MSNYIFETLDKSGRKIRLTKEQWSHISQRHPNIQELDIKQTLENPLKTIFADEMFVGIYYFYFKDIKRPAKYLKVIVKYLNGKGYVITSYFVKNML